MYSLAGRCLANAMSHVNYGANVNGREGVDLAAKIADVIKYEGNQRFEGRNDPVPEIFAHHGKICDGCVLLAGGCRHM